MIGANYFTVPTLISLGVIVLILAITVGISVLVTQSRGGANKRK
jgi:hypothetical protein